MSDTTVAEPTIHCSFCLKPADAVPKMIAGPGTYICSECVRLCDEILLSEPANSHQRTELPYWQGMSDDEMLSHLPKIAAVAAQIETSLATWVHRVRGRGVSWARIGAALDMTRQSAWGRFSGEE